MSKEKQIEEMALIIYSIMPIGLELSAAVATDLYNADYRKQSVGEWIYKEKEDAFFCSLCDQEALIDANTIGIDFAIAELSDYCPHCGAKMNGGA